MHATPPNSSSSSADEQPREVAPFLKSLRRMLEDEDAAVLRWTADGCAFEIHDMDEMMASVLPKYFKHRKYTSFQRQLNYFNFRKWTKSKAVVCTFSNDFFLRDRPELAWRITRKKSLHASPQQKYRSTLSPPSSARASAMPYWKKQRSTMVAPAPYASMPHMLLTDGTDPRRRLPFPTTADADLELKESDLRQAQYPSLATRRFYGCVNVAVPSSDAYGRGFDLGSSAEQTEPLDWIDCLLPPPEETFMSMYPPTAAVPVGPASMRKCFDFMPSHL